MAGRQIFWDVDTQVDFIHSGGKLYVPGAEKLLPNLKRLTDWAARHSILMVASVDAHQPDDPEFADYPPHCLVGTPGQAKVPETVLAKRYVIPNRKVRLPGTFGDAQQIIVEKQALDVFTNPNTDSLLEKLGPDLEIVLYGVVTEICVEKAARGLLDRGHHVRLVTDAIQHIDPGKGEAARSAVQERGGEMVTTEALLSSG